MKKIIALSLFFLAACSNKTPEKPTVDLVLAPYATAEDVLRHYPKVLAEKFHATITDASMTHLVLMQPTLATDIAMAVLLEVQTTAGTTGPYSDQILAVFTRIDGKYVFRDQRRVGGRQFRQVTLLALSPTQVTLDATFLNAVGVGVKAHISYGLEPYRSLEELNLILDAATSAASNNAVNSSVNNPVVNNPPQAQPVIYTPGPSTEIPQVSRYSSYPPSVEVQPHLGEQGSGSSDDGSGSGGEAKHEAAE